MNGLAGSSTPLSVRGFLLALVVCLHVAGTMALSRLPEPERFGEEATILRASWIENLASDSPISAPPASQRAKPLPAARSARSPHPARMPKSLRTRPQPPARLPRPIETAQSALAPVTAEVSSAALAKPVASTAFEVPALDIGASAAVAGGITGRGRESEAREGAGSGNYVAPDYNVSYFSNPRPEYPAWSRRRREEGLVKLRVHVTAQGRADEVALHKSSGFERLDKAAADAVLRWRFRPAQRGGMSVADWVIVPVRFELQD